MPKIEVWVLTVAKTGAVGVMGPDEIADTGLPDAIATVKYGTKVAQLILKVTDQIPRSA